MVPGVEGEDPKTLTSASPAVEAGALRRCARIAWTGPKGAQLRTVDRCLLAGGASHVDIVVRDPTVSRLHAELEPRDGGVWVRDLGSRNGTFVNDVRVASALLPVGGRLRLGATEMMLRDDAVEQRVEMWKDERFGDLRGRSAVTRELFATLAHLAALDVTVLILGETGTGKELAARALHDASPRAERPFVVVDCAALPETLLETELFGHAKGAFTGAASARSGAIESASGGTVFLDEVGELPLSVQPKLLRVLDSRTVRRVGETAHRKVDFRFVSATHRDLPSMVNSGAFREDLYFRLAVVPVTMPPLRDRREDIPLLVEHFLPDMPAAAREQLVQSLASYPLLGNVRELKNLTERAAALGTARALSTPAAARASLDAGLAGSLEKSYRAFLDDMEREYVRHLVERHAGNVSAAARAAGLDRSYVHRLIRKHAR